MKLNKIITRGAFAIAAASTLAVMPVTAQAKRGRRCPPVVWLSGWNANLSCIYLFLCVDPPVQQGRNFRRLTCLFADLKPF